VGAPAPEFSITDSSGTTHTLAQYRGKNVVLEWFNPGCPFVKKFYKNGDMARFQKQVLAGGDIWLTINSSAEGRQGYLTPEEAKSTKEELGLTSTALLLDPEGAVGLKYGAKTTPHIFVVDARGVLAYAGAIDDKPSTDPGDIASATNYVLKSIQALKEGRGVEVPTSDPYGCSVKYKG
jgi:peroxiredoxin